MNYAGALKSASAQAEEGGSAAPLAHPTRTAVLDANAIINGIRLEDLATTAIVTISEVLTEVRDKQSRQFLASLPFGIETREPSEESLKAVLRFARETGDVHALSSADVKLVALAHTLEVQAHGGGHLREHPVQASVPASHGTRNKM